MIVHSFIPQLAEQRRVAHHIQRAERAARASDTSSLAPLQRLVRGLLLRELARYREAGRFPKNRDFGEPTPYFVDAEGTRCAMAHLLEVGGEGELVARIAKERNNAFVRELADEPRLLAWLAAAGITVAEAAAIQPTYCDVQSACVCGGGFSRVQYPVPASGVLEGVVVAQDASGRSVVEIDRVHGDAGAHQVGGSFVASVYGAANGTRVLAPIGRAGDDAGAAVSDGGVATALPAVMLDDEGSYTCSGGDRSVGRELFLAAVQSSDCSGTLAAADARWRDSTCGGGGCAASGLDASTPTTLGILLAIVAILARRGRRGEPR